MPMGFVFHFSISNVIALQEKAPAEKKSQDYINKPICIDDASVGIGDLTFSFYSEVIWNGNYSAVIEVGSYDGKRIISLKKRFPHLDFYGLDIAPNYNEEFQKGDVGFKKFDLGFLRSLPHNGLELASGTLCYMTPIELQDFLEAIKGLPLAFMEPVPFFDHLDSIRRDGDSFYHPYRKILESKGYRLQLRKDESVKFLQNIGKGEQWMQNLANSNQ